MTAYLITMFCLIFGNVCIPIKGYIWRWALNDRPLVGRHIAEQESVDKRNGQTNLATQTNSSSQFRYCSSGKLCAEGEFCDRHYAMCMPLRHEGAPCRRDYQCITTCQCMYGRCHPMLMPPSVGARCTSDGDCGPGGCCARHHGARVCKARLRPAQRCFVPRGGLHYSLNEICPCQIGSICRKVAHRQRKDSYRPRQRSEVFRCAPI